MSPLLSQSPEKLLHSEAADGFTNVERLKSQFIATVSHELRTPLTSIHGALALVMSGAAGVLPERAKNLLTIAHRNSERLVRIINDILDSEKADCGKMRINLQKVALAPFLDQAVLYNEPYAEKFRVRFQVQEAPNVEILADPDRLMQVMTNLLSNAAKFSPAQSNVFVRAIATQDRVTVEVQDFGFGIPEEFQPRIFEKFAQGHDKNLPRREGTGLGLNLCRQMVELMGGEIGFRTKAQAGTTFYVHLQPAIQAGGA